MVRGTCVLTALTLFVLWLDLAAGIESPANPRSGLVAALQRRAYGCQVSPGLLVGYITGSRCHPGFLVPGSSGLIWFRLATRSRRGPRRAALRG